MLADHDDASARGLIVNMYREPVYSELMSKDKTAILLHIHYELPMPATACS